MNDEQYLITAYREVKKFREGELRISVVPRGKDQISVRIVGGKAKDFLIDKTED